MNSTGRDPDPAFERLVARGLAQETDRSGRACPDADLLAAWFDHALSPPERERVEAHVSSCESCQQIVAALARSEPEVIRAAPLPAPARPWHWHWRWVVPLATAVLVVVVGSRTLISPGPTGGPATPSEQAPPAEARRARAGEQTLQTPKPPATPQAVEQAPPGERTATAPPGAPAESLAANRPAPAQAAASPGAAAPVTMAVPAAPPPPASPAAPIGEVARLAPPPAAAGAQQGMEAAAQADAMKVSEAAAARSIVAGPSVSWRFGRDGRIEKSIDRGQSWELQSSGVATGLADASAPTDRVCWIVGARGVVVRTVDGRTWRRVTPPTGADLVAVHARSDLSATVTASDRAEYETADGGATWRRR